MKAGLLNGDHSTDVVGNRAMKPRRTLGQTKDEREVRRVHLGLERILAAGGEAAAMGDRNAEILIGVDRDVVDANFVVKMGTGGAAALADIADHVAAVHALSRGHGEAGKMAIAGADPVAMIDHDGFAVAA